MKDFIISTLDVLLSLTVIVSTIGGFLLLGNANPFGDFSFGMALVGGFAGFCLSAITTGGIFTLIRVKELLEKQVQHSEELIRYIRSTGISQPASTRATARMSSQAKAATATPPTRPVSPGNRPRPATSKPTQVTVTETVTAEDKQFLELISAEPSLTNAEIAGRLHISTDAVMMLTAKLRGELKVFTHAELVQKARDMGYI